MTELMEQRARLVAEWLEAHPNGGGARDIGRDLLISVVTIQKLLRVVIADGRGVAIGNGAQMRYAAPRHESTAQAHMDSGRDARTEARRQMRNERAARDNTQGLCQRPYGTAVEEPHQPIVSQWPKARKLGPSSVFEWSQS